MVQRLLGRNQALSKQQLNVTMVASAHDNLTLAQVIHTTVADVRPPGRMLLDEASCAGRARPLFQRKAQSNAHDLFMRTTQGHVQEAQRIEQRLGCMPERFEKSLLRDLGGASTIRVPAHAVDHEKQNRMLGDSRDDTILVFFARPEQ
jgi:hypothetical protein